MEKPMNVILSIKPEFVEKILSGVKKYEYRKVAFKRPVSRVYIYSSSPVKRIVAEFMLDTVLSDSPIKIWEKTKDFSGIEKKYFFEYFGDREQAFALKIKNLHIYNQMYNPYEILPNFIAPQSYCYIDKIDFL